MDWSKFGDLVRRRRLSLDLSQDELGARAGITPVTISRIENGQPAKTRTLWKLDRGLDWQGGSSEDFLSKGAAPVELPARGEIYTDPDEAKIWEIEDLSEDRRREWIAQLRKTRADILHEHP